jgi:hypothetical protein
VSATSIQWTDIKGRSLGRFKAAARRVGLSFDEYRARLDRGELWCTGCRAWHASTAFGVDGSRWSGKAATCLASRHTGNPRGWPFTPRINPKTGRPGAPQIPRRDGDKKQARSRVNHDVTLGLRPNPNSLACFDCGHLGTDKRHEYDHYLGYAAAHHGDVQAVCSTCHHKREASRGH